MLKRARESKRTSISSTSAISSPAKQPREKFKPRIAGSDQHERRKRQQKHSAAPPERRMQTPVFDRVVENARKRRDFGDGYESPKSHCLKHVAKQERDAPDCRQKDAAARQNHDALVDRRTAPQIERNRDQQEEHQTGSEIHGESASLQRSERGRVS